MSHPTRVRGLKLRFAFSKLILCVAPYTGAWIEMSNLSDITFNVNVAPYTGAWIEMSTYIPACTSSPMSHPTRVRGLKSSEETVTCNMDGRTLHGCVD